MVLCVAGLNALHEQAHPRIERQLHQASAALGAQYPAVRHDPAGILEIHPIDPGVREVGQVPVKQAGDVGVEQFGREWRVEQPEAAVFSGSVFSRREKWLEAAVFGGSVFSVQAEGEGGNLRAEPESQT